MAADSRKRPTLEEARRTHHAPIVRRPHEYPPEMGRFANTTQMVFHPDSIDPTQPNAGILTYLPGAGFPLHLHDFAQMWYILEGECRFGETIVKAGDMVYMQDPHFEYEMSTDHGCKILFMQYPGATTGARPIYEGRFNKKRVEVGAEDLKR